MLELFTTSYGVNIQVVRNGINAPWNCLDDSEYGVRATRATIRWNDDHGWTHIEPPAYVFAGYADGNARSVNRDPDTPRC
ncbi:hypothetical protein [Streptomyces violascens]|uniref:Uncharacterized protein n=1 Tax=Streptomyces violascens TaxID=67381 RepID=A0ABQ3QTB7_9ACTN|nr:hypothetical protein [Streptomyces violascens]GHI40527.1 hypothetical protein Sviol_49350 [Streptomyces violascens]